MIQNGLLLEKADKFCYLGDMFNADEGYDLAVTASIRSAWKKLKSSQSICVYQPRNGFSLKLKGNVNTSCVRSCLIYGCETWPMKTEHELKLDRTELIRQMCGFTLEKKKKNAELRKLLGLEPVSL